MRNNKIYYFVVQPAIAPVLDNRHHAERDWCCARAEQQPALIVLYEHNRHELLHRKAHSPVPSTV
jgi:hypothetical protein